MTEAAKHGLHLPVLEQMMHKGWYAEGVVAVTPTLTFPGHATLVTGVSPKEHGIFNNVRFSATQRNKDVWFWYASDLKSRTLWDAAKDAGLTTASAFWPETVNNDHIDYLLPAYPVRIREDNQLMEALSRPLGFLRRVEEQTGPFYIFGATPAFDEQLTRISLAMIQSGKPKFMTLHLVSLDHAEHSSGPFSATSLESITAIDGMIGRLRNAMLANDPHAIVVVASDHGFAKTHTSVNLLVPFVQQGLITLKNSNGSSPIITDWKATLWEAGGSAYVRVKDPTDHQLVQHVAAVLNRLMHNPALGIARVLTHDEIVSRGGDPDSSFLVEWRPGFSFGGALTGALTREIPGTGTHGYLPDRPEMYASFFAIGNAVTPHCDLGIIDMRQIAPTIASWLKVDMPTAEKRPLQCPADGSASKP